MANSAFSRATSVNDVLNHGWRNGRELTRQGSAKSVVVLESAATMAEEFFRVEGVARRRARGEAFLVEKQVDGSGTFGVVGAMHPCGGHRRRESGNRSSRRNASGVEATRPEVDGARGLLADIRRV